MLKLGVNEGVFEVSVYLQQYKKAGLVIMIFAE
jgi:hypothetical protein